jgi:hypothetical protein
MTARPNADNSALLVSLSHDPMNIDVFQFSATKP